MATGPVFLFTKVTQRNDRFPINPKCNTSLLSKLLCFSALTVIFLLFFFSRNISVQASKLAILMLFWVKNFTNSLVHFPRFINKKNEAEEHLCFPAPEGFMIGTVAFFLEDFVQSKFQFCSLDLYFSILRI